MEPTNRVQKQTNWSNEIFGAIYDVNGRETNDTELFYEAVRHRLGAAGISLTSNETVGEVEGRPAAGLKSLPNEKNDVTIAAPLDGDALRQEHGDLIAASEAAIQAGDLQKAQGILERILLHSPRDITALNDLAVIKILKKEFMSAAETVAMVLEKEPDNTIAHNNLNVLKANLSREMDSLQRSREPLHKSQSEPYIQGSPVNDGRKNPADRERSPLVSIIVATRNRPGMLADTLASVSRQIYKNLEVLVVNDGGEDVSSLLDRFRGSVTIEYFAHTTNRGPAAARNTALKAARGEYVCYLDDDDIFYPEHVDTLVQELVRTDCGVAYTDAHRATQILADGRYQTVSVDLPYSDDFDREKMMRGNFIPILCVMHKRSIIDEVGGYDETLTSHVDWDLWIRMAMKYEFRHIRSTTCLFTWRLDGSSLTSKKTEDFTRTAAMIYQKYNSVFSRTPGLVDLQKKGILDRVRERRENARRLADQGDLAEALAAMKRLADLKATLSDDDRYLSVDFTAENRLDAEVLRDLAQKAGERGMRAEADEALRIILSPDAVDRTAASALFNSKQHQIGSSDPEIATDKGDFQTTSRLVSIVIPVYNKLEFTKKCLESISRNSADSNYEIIVVDNASTDGTGDYLRGLARTGAAIRPVINTQNLGFVGACNLGARAARGEYVLFLNNDTQVQAKWLSSLVDLAEKKGDCGAVGSKLVYPDGRLQEAGGIIFADGNGWNYGKGGNPHEPKYNYVREVDYISGASLMIRKKLLDEIGGFDERYAPAYYEDTDLCFEVRKRGYKVYYQPHSVVVHYEGMTAGTNLNEGFKKYQTINKPKFVEKWSRELLDQPPNDPKRIDTLCRRNADRDKNVMIIDPFLPMYDRASGSLRLWQIIKMLREMRCHVTFIARNGSLENVYRPSLEDLGVEVYAWDRKAMRAAGVQNNSLPEIDFERLFRERAYGYAIVDFWDVAKYYVPLIRRLSPGTTVIVDSVDIHFIREAREAELTGNRDKARDAAMNKQRELAVYRKADRIWVVTPADRDAISDQMGNIPIDVIPNIHEHVTGSAEYRTSSDMIFVGNFNHIPNRDAVHFFVSEILPLIRKELPEVKFYIVGNNPPDDVKSLASDSVVVTGYVKDLAPYLMKARISVAPLRYGAGMKGKIGDALSHGVPTVSTSVGSEGMALLAGEDILVADDPRMFAQSVVSLYKDEELWKKLSTNGKTKIEGLYSPAEIKMRLESIFQGPTVRKPDEAQKLSSIVILTYNQLDYTRITIDSIRRHTKSPYEIIIVDNASTDGTVEYLKAQKDIRTIFNEENVGFPAGCNQGMGVAKGDYIVLLNNDVIVTDGWLEGMIECSEADPKIGIVGPMTNWISGCQLEPNANYKKASQVQEFAAKYRRKNRKRWLEVPRVAGFCMLIKRTLLDQIGGLDSAFGIGICEDDDYCMRARLAGSRIAVAREVFIHHFGSKSFGKDGLEKYREVIRVNETIFKKKWGVTPKEWWKEGNEPTKISDVRIPLDGRELVPVPLNE